MSQVLDYLRADPTRDLTAQQIARALGMREEAVYLELIPAYTREQVRLCCGRKDGQLRSEQRTWSAM